jgi:hypothetical protein
MTPTRDEGPAYSRSEQSERPPRAAYEPPQIIRLGTIQELTLGTTTSAHTDGTFPGSLFG